jgi:hypothetical protein
MPDMPDMQMSITRDTDGEGDDREVGRRRTTAQSARASR